MAKEGDHYIWMTNKNKQLTKRIRFDGKRKFFAYYASDNEYIEIFVNTYDLWGCGHQNHVWQGNLVATQKLPNGIIIKYRGYAFPYEGLIQNRLCKAKSWYP